MAKLFSLPKQIPLISGGAVLPGAKLTFSATGTSTLQNTYQDSALATPHANPVVADADGVFAPIYFDPALPDYRVRLTTSADVLVYQVDGVPSNENEAQSFRLTAAAPEILLHETGAGANVGKWLIRVANQGLRISLLNDAEVIQGDIFNMDRTGVATANVDFLPSSAGTVDVLRGGVGLFEYKNQKVAVHVSGTFTGTFTGFASANTRQIEYNVYGDPTTNGATGIVVLTIPTGVATSNATTMTMTGIPAGIAASAGCLQPIFVTDNGTNVAGSVRILLASATTLRFGVAAAEGGFTGSGNKGFPTTGEWFQVIYKTAG